MLFHIGSSALLLNKVSEVMDPLSIPSDTLPGSACETPAATWLVSGTGHLNWSPVGGGDANSEEVERADPTPGGCSHPSPTGARP